MTENGAYSFLTARGLCKAYGGKASKRAMAVAGVDFDIGERAFTTLLGPSGCGKTTILRLIAGFEHPSAGELRLEGVSLAGVPPERRPVNTVFQSYALFPHLSVADNVAFSLKLRRSEGDIARKVAGALAAVHMAEYADRFPHELSGGQQQRVAVARAMIAEPRLLLLDEPLSALDRKMRLHLQGELKDLQRRLGIAFVYVTHDQEEAFALSDFIFVMNKGRIVQTGRPEDIYARPVNTFVADFIGGGVMVPAEVRQCAGASAWIATPLGLYEAPASPALNAASQAALVLRPEALLSCAASDAGAFAAVVSSVVFRGDRFTIGAEVGDLSLRFNSEVLLDVGARISLRLDPRKTFVTAVGD